jgi:hypothetical protein
VPVSRRRKREPATGPDVRGYLRKSLDSIIGRLVARDGAVNEVFERAYRLDRIEDLKAGRPVDVIGYEISGVVPGIERMTLYTIDEKGRVRRNDQT